METLGIGWEMVVSGQSKPQESAAKHAVTTNIRGNGQMIKEPDHQAFISILFYVSRRYGTSVKWHIM